MQTCTVATDTALTRSLLSSRRHSVYFVWGIYQISRGIFLFQEMIKVRPLCFCLATIPVFFCCFCEGCSAFCPEAWYPVHGSVNIYRHERALFVLQNRYVYLECANEYALLTKRDVKMAGYWPSSLCLGQSEHTKKTNFVPRKSTLETRLKKCVANIHPSWPNKLGKQRIYYMAKSGTNAENSERASRVANQNAGLASSCSLADSRNTGNIFAQLVAQHCCIAS